MNPHTCEQQTQIVSANKLEQQPLGTSGIEDIPQSVPATGRTNNTRTSAVNHNDNATSDQMGFNHLAHLKGEKMAGTVINNFSQIRGINNIH